MTVARRNLSRRKFLAGAGGLGLAGAGAAAGLIATDHDAAATPDAGLAHVTLPHVALPAAAAGLPVRQHAWQSTYAADRFGNPVAPRFDRLLLFDVVGAPTPAHARILEAALRRLEHAHAWGPGGLLFTAGWSHAYFADLLKTTSPVPPAKPLADIEDPTLDTYHLCLHLASDDESRLAAIEADLLHGPDRITQALRWRETRTGFNGKGLPAAHQNVGGIPAGDPVPASAPLYMGFQSNLKGNQASEDDVTIAAGPFREGTTMAVSQMRLDLASWYGDGMNQADRVALMYSPETTVKAEEAVTTEIEGNPSQIGAAINSGRIGHSQASARARRNGKAIILRRDFDTADGGQAGLHFVSLQRDIQDFVTTRTKMNASDAQLQNPAVTETVNNGINAFIFVLKRANYVLPARAQRSFPLLPGRLTALT